MAGQPVDRTERDTDDVLALRIRSIGEGAKLTVEEGPNGPFLRRWRPRETLVAASPVRLFREEAGA